MSASQHVLKTKQPWFERVWSGTKTAELRLNDRDVPFQIGDRVRLVEWTGEAFTKRYVECVISDVEPYQDALREGWVMLSLQDQRKGFYGWQSIDWEPPESHVMRWQTYR